MERMATSLLSKDNRDFWQEIRNVSAASRGHANVIDGVQGETGINEVFLNKYKSLYTSVPYDKNTMHNIENTVNHNVSISCCKGKCSVDHEISTDDVVKAISKLKLFKADASFDLYSNNLMHGCNELYVHLSLLFKCILHHGHSPEAMNLSTLIPIPKNTKKAVSDSSNYRAIAIGSVVGKVLDHIIMFKNMDSLCTSELQFGFKSNHSTTQCTFVLQEIIDLYQRNNSSLYLVLLDASQAFDRVEYCKLFDILIKRNVCSCTIRLLVSMYTNQRLRVKWGDNPSQSFLSLNGVKQGGVLSPILFCIYMDELLSRLSLAGVGCYVGTRFYGALCYADDLTLLCPSRRSMNIMLKICEDFALEYGVKFNSTKSVLVTYNVEIDVCFMLNNAPIVQSESALHLGHYIGKDCNQKNISLGVRNLIGRTNTMLSRFSYCSSFIKSTLFKTYCTSYYGCVLWRLDSSAVQKCYVSWRKIIRRIWGLPYRTHCRFLPILVSENPPENSLTFTGF